MTPGLQVSERRDRFRTVDANRGRICFPGSKGGSAFRSQALSDFLEDQSGEDLQAGTLEHWNARATFSSLRRINLENIKATKMFLKLLNATEMSIVFLWRGCCLSN